MSDKQQVVNRLEGKKITILNENVLYSEIHKKVKFMFKGFEFETEYWDKSDGEMGEYDNDLIITLNGKDILKSKKFDDEFLDELNEALYDEVM